MGIKIHEIFSSECDWLYFSIDIMDELDQTGETMGCRNTHARQEDEGSNGRKRKPRPTWTKTPQERWCVEYMGRCIGKPEDRKVVEPTEDVSRYIAWSDVDFTFISALACTPPGYYPPSCYVADEMVGFITEVCLKLERILLHVVPF